MTGNPLPSQGGGGLRKIAGWTWRGTRLMYRHLPSGRRCTVCFVPLDGPFAVPFKIVQIRPSRKNPTMCTSCYELAPLGGELVTLSVVFVDVRGFTTLSERLPPTELVTRLNQFYRVATKVVLDLDGTLDKMIGDEVMAFFGAPFRAHDHPQRAIRAALGIVKGMEAVAEDSDSLHVGGGVATGEALMGNVGDGEVRDFTVIGDVVNTAARLQGAAQPGEVVVMEETYRPMAAQFPDALQRTLELKGKARPVVVRVLRASFPSG